MQDVRDKDPAIAQLNTTVAPRHFLLGIPSLLDSEYTDSFIKHSQEGAAAFADLPIKKGLRFNINSGVEVEAAVQETCGKMGRGNILELAYHYLSYIGELPLPGIQPCNAPAPNEPTRGTMAAIRILAINLPLDPLVFGTPRGTLQISILKNVILPRPSPRPFTSSLMD